MRYITLISSFLLAASVSFAGPKCQDKNFGLKSMKELNLTDVQKTQFNRIKEKYSNQQSEKRQLIMAAKEELTQSLQNSQRGVEYNKQLIEKFNKVETLKAEQSRQRFEMSLEIREILTDEQLKKFKTVHDKEHHKGHDKVRKGKKDHKEEFSD
jgi:Spy/CpxP family protein refolding chaperone